MQIAMSKTREEFPLSKKKVIKKTIAQAGKYIVFVLFLYVLISIFFFSINLSWDELKVGTAFIIGIPILILIALFEGVYFYQRWYFATYFYDLTQDHVVIRKNPITPREITLPYERIQDVYVDQDVLDRLFGLYDVHISSATIASGMEAHIDGVEKIAAEGLRAALLKNIHERISKKSV